jgi:hypothetical protein
MRNSAGIVHDMTTLARLHAALDSVVETEQLIATIRDASLTHSVAHSPAVTRLAEVVGEARELLRSLLARPESRQLSGS